MEALGPKPQPASRLTQMERKPDKKQWSGWGAAAAAAVDEPSEAPPTAQAADAAEPESKVEEQTDTVEEVKKEPWKVPGARNEPFRYEIRDSRKIHVYICIHMRIKKKERTL